MNDINIVNALIDEAKRTLNNATVVPIGQAWRILQITTAKVVRIIEDNSSNLSNAEKKQVALDYISKFYDIVFLVVKIPLIPPFLDSIIHRYIKKILMIMVGASIDATVAIFRDTGVFSKKEVINNGN